MSAELGDPESFKRALREASGEVSIEEIRDAVEQAAEYANENFRRAGENPPAGASMPEWNMQPIIDSLEIRRVEGETQGKLAQGDAFIAEWQHPHTDKMEVGVRPHEITGNPLLVFEDWATGETVFTTRVDHPGNPGIGAIRDGFRRVIEERFA